MGLFTDLHNPRLGDIVGRAAIEGEAASYVRVDSFITAARAQHEQYTPSTAEGRHEALLWDVPLDGGDVESGALAECNPFLDDAVLIEYAQDFEAGEELIAEFASDARYDEPFADDEDPWFDLGTCSGCGAYGRLRREHWGCPAAGTYL